MQLLKTAVWLFQLYGYRVTFNIFDLDKSIQEQIEHECPELIEKNGLQMSGEANYEIHFFTGIDCCTSAFEELLNSEKGQQIKDSQMFFVSLGQDDKNIEVAIQIRRFFAQEEAFEAASMVEQLQDQNEREAQAKAERDRLQNKDLGDEKPLIYAVVYSDQKVSNLNVDDGLKNFNGQSYGVRFVGAFSEENSYDRIIKKSGMERIAFQYHIEWVSKDDAEVSEELLKKAEHYVNYSYYRKSSMAQVIHQRVIKEIMEEIDDISVKEHIDRKEIIKVSEHMRWNAYMRQEGYRYCIVRNDRAKLHNNLVPFEQLSEDDKKKDIINYEVEQVR